MWVYFDPDQYNDFVINYPTLLNCSYGFGFHPLSASVTESQKTDEKLRNTVLKIILDFLENQKKEAVLLYHCDHSDGKQAARHRKFNQWHNCFPDNHRVIRETIELEKISQDGKSEKYYMGYITMKDNSNSISVKSEFENFAIELANKEK
jgi:hypothetical protein